MGVDQALAERLALTMARLHTRRFLVDSWAAVMDESGPPCPWYPTWREWAEAAKSGRWPDLSKAPWES